MIVLLAGLGCVVVVGQSVPSVASAPTRGFVPGEKLRLAETPLALAVTDVEGDGHLDLVVFGGEGTVRVFSGRGDGRFRPLPPMPLKDGVVHFARSADLNKDGRGDLVVSRWGAQWPEVDVLLSRGDGRFTEVRLSEPPARPSAGVWTGPLPFEVGLFNGDEHLDVVCGDPWRNELVVFPGAGDGTFGVPIRSVVPEPARLLARLDSRGRRGIVWSGAHHHIARLTVLGEGKLGVAEPAVTLERAIALESADLNGDGLADLAVLQHHRDVGTILMQQADGSFRPGKDVDLDDMPTGLAALDFDQDGAMDLAVTSWMRGEVLILSGGGDGSFNAVQRLGVCASPRQLVTADLDRDGYPDLVCLGDLEAVVSVLMNRDAALVQGGAVGGPGPVHSFPNPQQPGPGGSPGGASAAVESRNGEGRSAPRGQTEAVETPRLRSPSHYGISHWSTDEGLPINTVRAMVQLRDGYLWLGTPAGLARFDGMRFKVFDSTSSPALEKQDIRSLAEDPQGGLWLGTSRGLVRFHQNRFESIPLVETNSAYEVVSLHVRPDGAVYCGTEVGFRRIEEGRLVRVFPQFADGDSPTRVAESPDGTWWMAARHGLWRWVPAQGDLRLAYHIRGTVLIPEGVGFPRIDRSGHVWFSNIGDLYRLGPDGISIHTPTAGEPWGGITGLEEDADGVMWWGRLSGLYRLEGDRMTRFTSRDGLVGDAIACVLPTGDGGVWVGSEKGGLQRLSPRQLVTYTTEDGLPSDTVWSISEGHDGSLWIATEMGVVRFSGAGFTTLKTDASLKYGSFRWAHEDSDGTVWGGGSHGLGRLDGDTFVAEPEPAIARMGPAGSAYLAPDGVFWISCGPWLATRSAGRWSTDAFRDGAGRLVGISAIFQDLTGALWFGTVDSGVFQRTATGLRPWHRSEGLAADHAGAVLGDADGTIWFASDRGLGVFRNGRIKTLTTAQGLAENVVMNVLDDRAGWLWVNGNRGIHRMRRSELVAVADGRLQRVDTVSYGVSDGMKSSEGNGGFLPNSCRSRDGRLWFPTIRGLVMVDPSLVHGTTTGLEAMVDRVLADDQTVLERVSPGAPPVVASALLPADRASRQSSHPAGLQFPAGMARRLDLDYTAPVASDAAQTRFRYRLKGHEEAWREGGPNRRATYTDLRPGRYQFEVMARRASMPWPEKASVLPITIAPFVHQTGWFYLLSGGVLAASAAGVQRYRLAAQQRRLREEQAAALTRERVRIARDMHDDLGASLTRITRLSDEASRSIAAGQSAVGQLQGISESAGRIIDEMGELIWATNPKYDTLGSLVSYMREYLNRWQEETRIDCRIDFPEACGENPLTAEYRRHVFLVLKEALQNIRKHAQPPEQLGPKALNVTVRLSVDSSRILLEIRDNGCGFEMGTGGGRGRGHGLENMRHRMEQLGGSCELQSTPGAGTVVVAQAPLRSAPPGGLRT